MPLAYAQHQGGPARTPADLSDSAVRKRLTSAAINGMSNLADHWRLTTPEVCALLGGLSERNWFRRKKNETNTPLSQDTLMRISALLGIFKGLRILFSLPLADEWVRLPNKHQLFNEKRPLDFMIHGGIPSMVETRRYIDALRGGL